MKKERRETQDLELSRLLAGRKEQILDRWIQRSGYVHHHERFSRQQLRDHLPQFLEEVAAALSEATASSSQRAPKHASTAHGVQRLRIGYDLVQVLREYELLADCLLEEVQSIGISLSMTQMRHLLGFLDEGRTAAATAYVSLRDQEIAEAHAQHVAFIAHEQRSPLMNAMLAAQALRLNPNSEQALQLISRNLARLRELIDEVLTTQKLEGPIHINCGWLDLRELADEMRTEMLPAAAHRQVAIAIEGPEQLPLRADVRLVRSAVGNLLGNAIKFTHPGSSVTVRLGEGVDEVLLEVQDACGGLAQEHP
ncbi:MAG: sensor histidine kinase, partial [Sinobacteraceae bacterium]|nr:sensor histidine kinase [Nevskiaceae bacterium]